MANENCCIAVYDGLDRVMAAAQALQGGINNVSVVSCCSGESGGVGYFCAHGRHVFRGETAEFWNAVCGRDRATAVLWMATLGMIIIVGPFAGVFLTVMEEGQASPPPSPLGEALHRINVPRDSIVHYEAALQSAHSLLVALGSEDEVAQAHELLAEGSARDMAIHLG